MLILTENRIFEKARRSPEDALSILPEVIKELDAVRFYALLAAVFKKIEDYERQQKLIELAKKRVNEAFNLSENDFKEEMRAFIIGMGFAFDFPTYNKDFLDKCKESFPTTFERFTKEYDEILKGWEQGQ